MAHNVEGARDVVQNFRDVLADLPQATAACGAVAAAQWRVNDRAARQVFGQLAQARPGLGLAFLALLLRRPNITCKIGGLGLPFWGFGFEKRSDPVGYLELAQTWQPYVDAAIDAFGAERCMMESNYPPDGRAAGFVPLWNALKHMVRGASADEKAALFRRTAARVYGLPGYD
jgi:predicted TIM-barrel fold metal-dependent hydrolase